MSKEAIEDIKYLAKRLKGIIEFSTELEGLSSIKQIVLEQTQAAHKAKNDALEAINYKIKLLSEIDEAEAKLEEATRNVSKAEAKAKEAYEAEKQGILAEAKKRANGIIQDASEKRDAILKEISENTIKSNQIKREVQEAESRLQAIRTEMEALRKRF